VRIIAGTARGRRLVTPARGSGAQSIRPTADRAREALFSIIGAEVMGGAVLDLFAGTGALALEALSRGAASALLVDRGHQALEIVRRNIALCGFADRALVLKRDLARGLAPLRQAAPPTGFDLVFLDPPYGQGLGQQVLAELADSGLVAPAGLVVAEEASGAVFADRYGGLVLRDHRRYGDTGFWLFRPESPRR